MSIRTSRLASLGRALAGFGTGAAVAAWGVETVQFAQGHGGSLYRYAYHTGSLAIGLRVAATLGPFYGTLVGVGALGIEYAYDLGRMLWGEFKKADRAMRNGIFPFQPFKWMRFR